MMASSEETIERFIFCIPISPALYIGNKCFHTLFRKMAMFRLVEVSKAEELTAVWLRVGEEVGRGEEVEEV